MTDGIVQIISEAMQSKSTEELARILEENDRQKYSDAAFEAIRQVLRERGEHTESQLEIPSRQDRSQSAMTRPERVETAVILLYGTLAMGVLRVVLESSTSRQTYQSLFKLGDQVAPVPRPIWVVLFVGIAALVIIWGTFLISMIAKGRNWARITFLVLFILGVPLSISPLLKSLATNPVSGLLGLVQAALQLIALVLLFQKTSSAWFVAPRAK